MSATIERRIGRWFAYLLILLASTVGTAAVASAGPVAGNATSPHNSVATWTTWEDPLVPTLFGLLSPEDGSPALSVQITDLSDELYVVDLPSMGIHPIEGARPPNFEPDTGAVGLLGAYMSVSPDVVSQTIPSGFGAASGNWMPGELVAVSLNGGAPTNYMASATGRLGQIFNVGTGQGYITIEARGLTSGRQTGGVVEVRDAAPPVPGLAIAPHAINPNGSSHINVLGTRYIANSSITLARNGSNIATLTSGAAGSFYYQINVAAGPDASAIYSTFTSTVGSRAGQSIEERADAGVPPIGDQNISRAFVDRPVVPSTGGTLAIVGEGFLQGETVNVTGCGTLSSTADSNGAVRFFNGVSGSGVFNCLLSGGISGRVGRASGIAASNAINAPAAIAAPAAVAGTGTFTFMIDRLLPNQSGTVYLDGVAQGTLSTDSGGKAAVFVNKPTSGFLHIVRWVGTTGQVASAPLLFLPAGGTPTPTRTVTRTPTNTPTRTATNSPTNSPTNTPTHTNTPTNTPTRTNTPEPTQTTGGPSATPTHTPTNTPTNTPTHTPTSEPSTTPGAGSPTPTACPLQFTDVDATHTFYVYIRCLACRGIVSGYSTSPPCTTGTPCFQPGNDVTRGQMAKFVSNAAGYNDPIPPDQQTFTDVAPSSTFWLFVERVYLHGVISGYTTSPPCVTGTPCFMPGNNVTRGQTAKMVSNAAGYSEPIPPDQQTFTDVAPSSTFWLFVERAFLHGVIGGYTTSPPCTTGTPCFLPGNNVTRGQTSKFIANAFYPGCDTP
jgi:hypothetical protein